MKRIKLFKSATAIIITLVLSFGSIITTFAYEDQENINEENINVDNILKEIGYPQQVIDNQLSQSDKEEIYQLYISNPESISITSTVYELDVLHELDIYVNIPTEELIASGLTEEEIKQNDSDIEKYKSMSDDELKKIFDTDDVTIKLIREAMEPDENFYLKSGNYDISASGSVTSAEMFFTQSVSDYSSDDNISYYVQIYFDWNQCYALNCFSDIISTAWGGNLTHYPGFDWVDYHEPGWGQYMTWITPDLKEEVINAGVTYSFPQSLYECKAKTGAVRFDLRQNGRNNTTTKIISQYGHKVLVLGGGVSISQSGPSVSLTLGTKYDKSPQLQTIITY